MELIKEPDVKAKCCDNCGQNKGVESIVIKTDNYQHSITLCKKCRSSLTYLVNCADSEEENEQKYEEKVRWK